MSHAFHITAEDLSFVASARREAAADRRRPFTRRGVRWSYEPFLAVKSVVFEERLQPAEPAVVLALLVQALAIAMAKRP